MQTTMPDTRVTAAEVLEASRGMLQKQVYAVFSTPTNGIGPVMANLPAHLEHQCAIEAAGIMVAAGPHWTDDELYWEGEGLFIIRAGSLAQAKAIAAEDPMHIAGARRFVVRPWLINEGSVTVRVAFSTGKATLA